MKIATRLAWTICLMAVGANSVRAENVIGCNIYVPTPTCFDPDTFTYVLLGDDQSILDLSAIKTDPVVNPFYYVNQYLGYGTTNVTATLNAQGNTVVTFTGSNPILPSYQFNYGPPGSMTNGEPHFGLDAHSPNAISLTMLSTSWSDSAHPGQAGGAPILTVVPTNVPGPNEVGYITLFADVTAHGRTVGEWFEAPYTGTIPELANYTDVKVTLSDVGYIIVPTYIPLDQLNFGIMSPPGEIGSPFIPLPPYDGIILDPGDGMGGMGGSVTLSGIAPEPSSLISLATGLLLAAGYLARRGVLRRPVPAGRTA